MTTVYDTAMEIRGVILGQKSVADVIVALLKGGVVGFMCDGMCKTALGIVLKPMMAIYLYKYDKVGNRLSKETKVEGDIAGIVDSDVITREGVIKYSIIQEFNKILYNRCGLN